MTAIDLFRKAKDWGPTLFSLGFLTPLIAQSLERAEVAAPLGLTPLEFAFAVAIPLGLVAQFRGRWV